VKPRKNFIQNNRPVGDSNRVPSEYKFEALHLDQPIRFFLGGGGRQTRVSLEVGILLPYHTVSSFQKAAIWKLRKIFQTLFIDCQFIHMG
jgi:hypothetical protein